MNDPVTACYMPGRNRRLTLIVVPVMQYAITSNDPEFKRTSYKTQSWADAMEARGATALLVDEEFKEWVQKNRRGRQNYMVLGQYIRAKTFTDCMDAIGDFSIWCLSKGYVM